MESPVRGKWGFDTARPDAPQCGPSGRAPLLDFTSGYVTRAAALLPKQGTRAPWTLYQNYYRDWIAMRLQPIDDGVVGFSNSPRTLAALRKEAVVAMPSARL